MGDIIYYVFGALMLVLALAGVGTCLPGTATIWGLVVEEAKSFKGVVVAFVVTFLFALFSISLSLYVLDLSIDMLSSGWVIR